LYRMYRIITKVSVICALALCISAQAAAPDVENIKAALIAWSESFRTFSGEYFVEQEIHNPQEHFEGRVLPRQRWRMVCRIRGDDIYLETHPENMTGRKEVSFARLRGVSSSRTVDNTGFVSGRVNDTHENQIHLYTYMIPHVLFGNIEKYPLSKVLASGESAVFEEEGGLLFCHRNLENHQSVDILLAPDLQVLRIDRVRWFRPKPEDLEELGDVHPLRTTILMKSLELMQFANTGGVMFPEYAVQRFYDPDRAGLESARAALAAGEISRGAYLLRVSSSPVVEYMRDTFMADRYAINVPLSDADFVLDFPPGASVAGFPAESKQSDIRWRWSPWEWLQSHIPLLLGAVSLLGIVVSGSMLYARKKRPAA